MPSLLRRALRRHKCHWCGADVPDDGGFDAGGMSRYCSVECAQDAQTFTM